MRKQNGASSTPKQSRKVNSIFNTPLFDNRLPISFAITDAESKNKKFTVSKLI